MRHRFKKSMTLHLDIGGIVNKYCGKTTEPIYWAEWTNLSAE